MAKLTKHCNHVLANGVLCGAKPLRDNDFCYWHHKARTNLRARTNTADATSVGIVLPLLEDANGIQVALQQITQAVLDGRLDNRRAGLLLYSLQLAMMNIKNVQTDPDRAWGDHSNLIALGEEEPSGFNDALNGNPCLGHCTTCAEPDCSDRVLPQSPEPAPASAQTANIMKIQASCGAENFCASNATGKARNRRSAPFNRSACRPTSFRSMRRSAGSAR
jgi:hypothetical protein